MFFSSLSFTVVPLAPATINEEPVSCLDLTGADVIVTPAPFAAFEASFSQSQSAAHPALKAVSRNEFIAATHKTMRRLLQGNGTFTVQPVNGACANGLNPCYSSGGSTLTCCVVACSGQFGGPIGPNDNRALCSTPNGGLDFPAGATTPRPTTPISTTAPGSVPPVDGICGNPNFSQPCLAAGAGAPSICCAASGFQCAGTTGPTPFCAPI
ncbi:hypothetical protein KFL_003270110 [Klebsormidium nitens]|uniref:Uncharacterized protein n=1 Tax=Klebsormidium nitens TaxID=105231 RepID=A0A1Y1I7U2_KLENI|nr:hypothetical protein KFL_003270110 [Klebsormidium nitens]|eukprot:GAQ87044.1 hypothetical protein KFL_003270110 [Klebsormidium nitens]